MAEQARYELRDQAAWIVLDRPDKRNALSPNMIARLDGFLDRALDDAAVRAVVLTGNGPAFCAGADLAATKQGKMLDSGTSKGERNPFATLLQKLMHLPKPVIAAVNGPAFGGGLGLVAAADIALAVEDAVFSFSEVRLGLIPAMISVVVLPKIGSHHARRLFLTGRRFSAQEAVGCDLVNEVVAGDDLRPAVDREVRQIAKGGPMAVAEAKRLIDQIGTLSEDAAFDRASAWIAEISGSEEAREGVAAFSEKRPARWLK